MTDAKNADGGMEQQVYIAEYIEDNAYKHGLGLDIQVLHKEATRHEPQSPANCWARAQGYT